MIIEGAIAVKAALQNKKREIFKVYIDKDKKTKDFTFFDTKREIVDSS